MTTEGRGTFQKFFTHDELTKFVADAVQVTPVTAAPGVLYLFREVEAREEFLASTMRRVAVPRVPPYESLYAQHKPELECLADFVRKQGRVPAESDRFEAGDLIGLCGSVNRAFRTLIRIYGSDYWAANAERAKQDLLVYLALATFRGWTPFNQLPESLREDIRAHFSTYSRACASADELLFAVGNAATLRDVMETAGVGKLTPGGLYVHKTAMPSVGSLLRTYDGCGRVLVGTIEACNVVKLHRSHFGVSYLCYPEFDTSPHPALAGSVHVDLRTREVRIRDYSGSDNPPILHRKELFVCPDYPLRQKFEKLTRQEEKLLLLEDTARIGMRHFWNELIASRGLQFNGHVIRKVAVTKPTFPIPGLPDSSTDEP